MNLRELFSLYHNGFDNFPAWVDHHREMHAKHPLDCPEFGEAWLRRWEAIGRLLQSESITYALFEVGWAEVARHPLRHAIGVCVSLNRNDRKRARYDRPDGRRITILNGTIIKEWGAS